MFEFLRAEDQVGLNLETNKSNIPQCGMANGNKLSQASLWVFAKVYRLTVIIIIFTLVNTVCSIV